MITSAEKRNPENADRDTGNAHGRVESLTSPSCGIHNRPTQRSHACQGERAGAGENARPGNWPVLVTPVGLEQDDHRERYNCTQPYPTHDDSHTPHTSSSSKPVVATASRLHQHADGKRPCSLSSRPRILAAVPSTTCGWCGVLANMTVIGDPTAASVSMWSTHVHVQAAYRCEHCGRLLLAHAQADQEHIKFSGLNQLLEQAGDQLAWLPTKGSQPPDFTDVPEHIRDAAQEAYRCRSINAHRAAVLLARSVVEATAKDKGIKKGPLDRKIDEMQRLGFIREDVRQGAHEVRYLGNDMAHGDFTVNAADGDGEADEQPDLAEAVEPVSEDDSAEVLEIMTEVLEEVFIGPARVARVRLAREAKKAAPAPAA